ncbi:MAG: hypothetical protein KatS3mg110_3901 [Pirellulaceae bacterium]|nr:MAG: hypothetical protein KatS3mg110_3901 [Pirellulaceae bacterium]
MFQTWQMAYRVGASRLDEELAEKLLLADNDSWRELLQWVQHHPPSHRDQASLLEQTVIQACQVTEDPRRGQAFAELVEAIAACYRALHQKWAANYLWLLWLAKIATPEVVDRLVDLWLELPPDHSLHVALVFRPLLEPKRREALLRLFPRILTGIGHLPSAAVILDLSNYVFRKKLVPQHPAFDRRQELGNILGHLARHLEYLDERGMENMSRDQRRKLVDDCVSLGVALCHALSLMGDRQLAGKLYPVLELRHRRLRLEAAYALATLGEEAGRQALIQLAADPGARLRALAYADELDLLDQIPEELRTDSARAEAELASFLAEPTQMGLAPHELQLICHRRLYWPGYAEPVDCWLFRFTYHLTQGDYTNIGMVGPVTHAFAADLTRFDPDDLFAIFAGWHVEHDEIYQTEVAKLSEPSRHVMERLAGRLAQEGHEQVEPLRMGFFFGERVLLARSVCGGQAGLALADSDQVHWWPTSMGRGAFGPDEAFAWYAGRKLLAVFNSPATSQADHQTETA